MTLERDAKSEISAGERFAFGENWQRFLDLVDEDRVLGAVKSLQTMLSVDNLERLRFVDVGSGSGLFSLAAWRLGAEVLSFDFDPTSVACTTELRRRYANQDPRWKVMEGSALDAAFLGSVGTFDLVYSWGVLHHTGNMWQALANVERLVAPGGSLFISIYNDQGRASRTWTRVKRTYNSSGSVGRQAILRASETYFAGRRGLTSALRIARGRPRVVVARERGMDRKRDLLDWVGGWPFEVAKPEQIFDFFRQRGFVLHRLKTCAGGLGCNEFVFRR